MRYVSHRFGHPEEFRAEYAKANRLRKLATMVLLKVGNEPHVQVCAYVHTSLYKYIYIYIYIYTFCLYRQRRGRFKNKGIAATRQYSAETLLKFITKINQQETLSGAAAR